MKNRRKSLRLPRGWPFWAALAVLWTLPWAVMAVQDVLTLSDVGRNGLGAGFGAHDVFQVVFIAGYSGVRWLLGMAVLGAVALVAEWPQRRRGVSA